ncbi:hypothetical protein Pyn_36591 [Prunus yedoensis var. nudiflora]|uniref:PGG domain-containing protein n=1 Tax=Prunus yedoensis var. nudiflora TaxID=2094558 RepID=A0A314YKS8_PRUYE|nr:hypothetical protein Pyn_36591 [Prunus yedoensis var. nudiflora]
MSQVEFGNMSSKMLETLRVRNRGNNTVLHEAVRNGHNKVAEFLLKIDPKLACFENEAGESPLYLAAREGLLDILNQILQSSPSSAHGGSDGQTALHAAVVEKHFDIMEALLRFKQQLIKEADHQGKTPLYYAASLGDHRTVQQLLELDISIAYVLDKQGCSPIHVAASKGHTSVIREIVRHCPDSGELVDPYGWNALHIAIFNGQQTTTVHLIGIAEHNSKHLGTSRYRHSGLGNIKISPRAEQEEANAVQTYMQMGQTLLMVATLITTVTFAAAFTMPGGYNNDVGPDRGQALLQSNNDFKWFIITDTVAMTCSIIAACLLFWGAVNSNKSSYVYYFTSAAALTYIALQSTAIAFQTGIKAAMPDQQFLKTLGTLVGAAFHVITFLALSQLVKMFSLPEACRFFISHLCKLKRKIKNKP